jgi:hypothetical protein
MTYRMTYSCIHNRNLYNRYLYTSLQMESMMPMGTSKPERAGLIGVCHIDRVGLIGVCQIKTDKETDKETDEETDKDTGKTDNSTHTYNYLLQ